MSDDSSCEVVPKQEKKPVVTRSPVPLSPPPKRRRSLRQRVTSVVATQFKDSTPNTRVASTIILEELKNNESTSSNIVDSYDPNIACSQEVRNTLIEIHKN